MRKRILLALGLISVSLSTAVAQSPDTAVCYRFNKPYFAWLGMHPDRTFTRDSTDVIALLSHDDTLSYLPDGNAVRPIGARDTVGVGRYRAFSSWRLLGGVRLGWLNGFSGPVFRMTARGDSLRGQVRFTSDVRGIPEKVEPASAVRVRCGGDLVEARSIYDVGRNMYAARANDSTFVCAIAMQPLRQERLTADIKLTRGHRDWPPTPQELAEIQGFRARILRTFNVGMVRAEMSRSDIAMLLSTKFVEYALLVRQHDSLVVPLDILFDHPPDSAEVLALENLGVRNQKRPRSTTWYADVPD